MPTRRRRRKRCGTTSRPETTAMRPTGDSASATAGRNGRAAGHLPRSSWPSFLTGPLLSVWAGRLGVFGASGERRLRRLLPSGIVGLLRARLSLGGHAASRPARRCTCPDRCGCPPAGSGLALRMPRAIRSPDCDSSTYLPGRLGQRDGKERDDDAVQNALGQSKGGTELPVELLELHAVDDVRRRGGRESRWRRP